MQRNYQHTDMIKIISIKKIGIFQTKDNYIIYEDLMNKNICKNKKNPIKSKDHCKTNQSNEDRFF